ncbi:MAG: transcription elongation factor Spt5 [Thermoproteota archaeon]|nr:transcription elongation factor Spt5 [Candidatus Korarchaeota archaeon]RLG41005.1 MAG: transcription elongation factor Spt5 [Candidatus Korarchaeota archaeon]
MESRTQHALFFTIRMISGREINVIRLLMARTSATGARIKSILFIPRFKGYLFVEADREYEVRRLIRGLSKVRLVSTSPIPLQEIENLISAEAAGIEIEPGDIVKIIKGNFKGYRAVVLSVPEGGRGKMLTLKLLDIDRDWEIKMPFNHIKLLEKKGGEESEGGA